MTTFTLDSDHDTRALARVRQYRRRDGIGWYSMRPEARQLLVVAALIADPKGQLPKARLSEAMRHPHVVTRARELLAALAEADEADSAPATREGR